MIIYSALLSLAQNLKYGMLKKDWICYSIAINLQDKLPNYHNEELEYNNWSRILFWNGKAIGMVSVCEFYWFEHLIYLERNVKK